MTREEQKRQRRQQILLAGMDLFVRKGYTATTIGDIAAACGMSAGLLFHYFPSKEALYLALAEQGLEGTRSARSNPGDSPLQILSHTARVILAYLQKQPEMANMFVLMAQALRLESTPESVRRAAEQIDNISASVPLILEGQRLGEIRPGDPAALSLAFWSALQGIAESIAGSPGAPCPDAEWVIDIIRADESRKREKTE